MSPSGHDQARAPVSAAVDPARAGATAKLAAQITEWAAGDVPPEVAHATRRCLVNALGLAVAAGGHPDVDRLVGGLRRGGEDGAIGLPGRPDTLGALAAATVVGTAAHLEDFDDTHLETVIHPGPATLAALWALLAGPPVRSGAGRPAPGGTPQVLPVLACGVEVQLRIGRAMSPQHYDAGWHITGTCGPLGAATVAGLLFGLEADQLAMAWGAAASMALGHRQAFGTLLKPFHAGKAAANGILAALLVADGLDASPRVLEAPRGFFGVLAGGDWQPGALEGDPDRWLVEEVAYKPYPCGVVAHPAIEAAAGLAGELGGRGAAEVGAVRVRCHPLVVELMGDPEPLSGRAAKFSTAHVVAAALLRGRLGLAELSDRAVADPEIAKVRSVVTLEVDPALGRDAAVVSVELSGGALLERVVDPVVGSAGRPLDDAALSDKFGALTGPVLGEGPAEELLSALWSLDRGATAADLVSLARTPKEARP